MLITNAITTPTFANHESFHLRYGWLKKAYNQILDDDKIFSRDDAPIKLGVGKNMVRAIRFWAIANKIIAIKGSVKNHALEPTEMGNIIFSNKGLDPYIEKPDTLWLLHWLLFAPPCRIPVWWVIMNEFPATNINIEEMEESLVNRISSIPEWKTPSPKSIKKDIDVFIHTYSTRRDKLSIEDYLDCPFRQLRMIKQNSRDMMRFVFGKKYGLSPLITAFACLDFIHNSEITSKNISLSRFATEAGSVGNAFKINENELAELLNDESLADLIQIKNINGAQHLVLEQSARELSFKVLESAYGKKIPKKHIKQEIIAS